MPIGKVVRTVLGKNFRPVGEAWRALFVDMHKVVDYMIDAIPERARILDIGGGDGYVVNLMLNRRPDLHVTMTDIAPAIGSFIDRANLERVKLCPATRFTEIKDEFDVITICDVIHHILEVNRASFFATLANISRGRILIIKDIQPRTIIGLTSLLADIYITGDRHVTLVSIDDVSSYVRAAMGEMPCDVAFPYYPNYCLIFRPPHLQE